MRDRYDPGYPWAKRMQTTEQSRLFIYLNGHGVESTIKLQQSSKRMHSGDLNKILQELHDKGRYKEVLIFVDTCEGESFFDEITAPNVYMMSTSLREESAYASNPDKRYNTFLMDNFTREFTSWLHDGYPKQPDYKLSELAKTFDHSQIRSHIFFKETGMEMGSRPLEDIMLREYFPVENQLLQTGIDSKQEGVKFYQWDDLLAQH
eukprot:Macronucleus_2613.p1 GENE.Macronucleus_2613~~Macronucleus_2613.p1  ORF type:complete len:238 (+),score=31.53 Macronucleus_2613:97-714(+)